MESSEMVGAILPSSAVTWFARKNEHLEMIFPARIIAYFPPVHPSTCTLVIHFLNIQNLSFVIIAPHNLIRCFYLYKEYTNII